MYDWFFALLLVTIFAHSRFNTPASTRFSTTIAQFYFAEFAYIVRSLLLLVLLSRRDVSEVSVRRDLEAITGTALSRLPVA